MKPPATIAVVLLALAGTSAASAQSYNASGKIGYLGEWEVKGTLAKTPSRSGTDYAGSVTLRHVGLCSVNGVEEKQAVVQLKVASSRLEGTMAMADDSCRFVASAAAAGLLTCRNGQDVPISLSIDQAATAQK